jgi:hypothetical protein
MACCHVSERLLTIVYRNAFANKEFPEINYQKDHSFIVIGTTLLYMVQAYKSRPKKVYVASRKHTIVNFET